ncbi:aspartate ammonia-lyase [Bifidobacterium sp. 82T24]|uniref:aspartate ammonia-lyase n=1 Tax=Bifidobacterium pluvialisilvae TaxID=2834436 RepID=UPI001C58D683|nr:aspartate ammonia-lyase [Bifidobacterium pluvialisilvae]MBW3089022.1 aspartate ammonia-lyase [Bifidobacterium pluvialisilvae]
MARHATKITRKTHRDTATRTEHDCIGTFEVPAKAYWGIHTARAMENFQVSNIPDSTHPQLIKAYATIKKACATANEELGLIPGVQAGAIRQACMEIENGRWMDQFPVDVFQGGAGTSTNMNVNEVIANRALELAGHKKGDYEFIHPNDDVNKSQSTNDTYPAACRLALIDVLGPLAQSTDKLARAFHRLADRHINDVTVGRTQLQDAVPMTYGQEFHAFASFLKSDIAAFEALVPRLAVVNLGATAIGTGICANPEFRASAVRHLAQMTGLPITAAPDPVAAVTDMSVYVAVSSAVKNLAIHLKKAADDLRLLNSGPNAGFNDINVPARQAGSSIMPGKVNPVVPECVNQCVFSIFGMDTTVQWAAAEGQLQLNAFDPVIIHALLSGMELISRAMDVFREECVNGITINAEIGRHYAESTPSIAASLNEALGYEDAMTIAKEAEESGRTVREVAGERTRIPAAKLDELLDPIALSRRLGQTCRERTDRSGRGRDGRR